MREKFVMPELENKNEFFEESSNDGDRRWTFETNNPREILFKHMVEGQIMKDYESDLDAIGVSKESLVNLQEALIDPSLDERKREIFYCIPYELRAMQFKADLPEPSSDGVISTESWVRFVHNIIDLNKGSDPHLGFHVSPREIGKRKIQSARPMPGRREAWDIDGTEFDDRDERKMAYYSMSLERLFTKKGLRHVYVVRANLAPGNDHKPDNNGHWGRAATLSVITKLDLQGENLNVLLDKMQEQVNTVTKKEALES